MWPGDFSNLYVYSVNGNSKMHCRKNQEKHSKNHKAGYGYLTKPPPPTLFFFF